MNDATIIPPPQEQEGHFITKRIEEFRKSAFHDVFIMTILNENDDIEQTPISLDDVYKIQTKENR